MARSLFQFTNVLAIVLLTSSCNMSHATLKKATLPMEWPLLPLNEQQIIAVKECDLENLVSERYPEKVKTENLESTFTPSSDCDWATLALAYADRLGENEPVSESGINALSQAITDNYGVALATPIFYEYFGSISIVNPPPFSQQDITDVKIQYNWTGLGPEVNYLVEIHQANTSPMVTITPNSISASTKLELIRN